MMKKVIVLGALAAALLVGCGDPIPQNGWVQNQVDMKQVPGLEDCRYFAVKTVTNANTIHVIRCPDSSVSAEWKVQQGKTTTSMRSVTIDEARIDALWKQQKAEREAFLKSQAELQVQIDKARTGQ